MKISVNFKTKNPEERRLDSFEVDSKSEVITSELFYREISKRVMDVVLEVEKNEKLSPSVINVSCELGEVEYFVQKGRFRGGKVFVKESANSISGLEETVYEDIFLEKIDSFNAFSENSKESYKNNYHFYNIFPLPEDKMVLAKYGRIGEVGKETTFPISMLEYNLLRRTFDGYRNKTAKFGSDCFVVSEKQIEGQNDPQKTLSASEVLFSSLYATAKLLIDSVLSSNIVLSQSMFSEAKKNLEILRNCFSNKESDLNYFNEKLICVIEDLPRKASSIISLLARSESDYERIVEREEEIVNAVETFLANIDKKESNATSRTKSGGFSEDNIEISFLSKEETEKVFDLVDFPKDFRKKIVRAYSVKNLTTEKKYEKYKKESLVKTEKFLWHGSRNENWYSIITNGLLLHPDAIITGKMFGHGIYFAPSFTKSFGYTSARGSYWAKGNSSNCFMGIYKTAYGNPYFATSSGSYSKSQLEKKNAHCLHARASQSFLRNEEIVFYDENAMTISYLFEIESI